MKTNKKFTRKAMHKYGCSGALYASVNNELNHDNPVENQAIVVLAGGMMRAGEQCGMLWGSTLAAGKAANLKYPNQIQASELTLATSRRLLDSYAQHTRCVNCRDYSRADFTKPWHLVRYLILRAAACFKLADNWAPEAIREVQEGMQVQPILASEEINNCASEVIRKMGGTPEEIQAVAGFAGGLGLSGNGCGALAAALYQKALSLAKENPKRNLYSNREVNRILLRFKETTGGELRCEKICGRKFNTIHDHHQFIANGGCGKLIDQLASA